MPKLPIQESRESIATPPGVTVNPAVAASAGKSLQGFAGSLGQFGEAVGQIGDTWQKARVTHQYTAATNQNKASVDQLMADADAEVDFSEETRIAYHDELEKIKSREISIEDEGVKFQFESNNNLYMDKNRISLEGMFRQKLIAGQRVEIVKDGDLTKKSYTEVDASPAQRAQSVVDYLDRLEGYKDSGFIPPEIHANLVKDIEKWDYYRAMYDVGKDPQGTSQNLDGYSVTEKEKNELVNLATATIRRQDKVRDIANLAGQNEEEARLSELIYGDRTTPIAHKIAEINDSNLRGKSSDDYAIKARRFLTSKQGLVKTSSKMFTETVMLIEDANIDYAGDYSLDSQKKYLQKIQKIQSMIMGATDLELGDRQKLINSLVSRTSKNQSEATAALGDASQADGEENRYKTASDLYEENIPVFRYTAMRKYFQETEGVKGLKAADHKRIMYRVMQEATAKGRQDHANLMTAANTKFSDKGWKMSTEFDQEGELVLHRTMNGRKFKQPYEIKDGKVVFIMPKNSKK